MNRWAEDGSRCWTSRRAAWPVEAKVAELPDRGIPPPPAGPNEPSPPLPETPEAVNAASRLRMPFPAEFSLGGKGGGAIDMYAGRP